MLLFIPVRALIRSRMTSAFHVWSAFPWVPSYLKLGLGCHCSGYDLGVLDGLDDYWESVLALLWNQESDLQKLYYRVSCDIPLGSASDELT